MKNIEVVNFKPEYSTYFYKLNIEWIEKYFYVEPVDEIVLANPQEYIIDKGGYVFFLKHKEEIVGTLALINRKECFELSKMAVLPKYQGFKIRQQLIDFAIKFSKEKGWKKMMLYSNTKLTPAIQLYKKVGFKKVALEKNTDYERSNIKMVLTL